MKKLLSILATVGLASTAGAAVVACGGATSGPKVTTRDAKAPATVAYSLSKKYDDTTSLEPEDRAALKNIVLGTLKEANRDCNFTDETFDIKIPEDIKKTATSLTVEVSKTDPTDEKNGLNETTLTVGINITDPVVQIEAQGVTVKMNLSKTAAGVPLHKDDKIELEKNIIAQLKEKNKNAVIKEDTFSVTIRYDVTPETKEILAKNKETASSGQRPGLIPSDQIKIELELTPIHGQVPAKAPDEDVVMEVATGPNDLINDTDKEVLKKEIKAALELANSNAVITEDTFVIELPEDLKNGPDQKIEVFVRQTQGTTEKDGLMAGPVDVTFTLNSFQDKVNATGLKDFKFELEETHLGETLTTKDKTNLQAEILALLKDANKTAVILEDTFGFEVLDSLIVQKEHDFIGITVKETESTYELHGLNSTPAIVKLTLLPVVKDKVKANLPAEPVQIDLKETHERENLNDADKTLVKTAVEEALKVSNKNAVVNDETFDVEHLEEMNVSAKSINVLVHSTDSTIDNPGLEDEVITVQISLTPMQRVVEPRGAKVEFKLEGSLIGEELTEKDKANLEAKILEQLKEANNGRNIQEDTFEINLDEFTVVEDEALSVHVNATEATNEKQGLSEKDVIVDIHLILFIDELSKLIPDVELGFIDNNEAKTILEELIVQNPNAMGEVEVESVTDTTAIIIATNPKKYQGNVVVNFNVIQEVAALLEGHADLGYVDTVEEAKAKAEEVVNSIEALKDRVTIGDPANNEITVSANHESLKGTAILNYVLIQDINDLLKDASILPFYVNDETAISAVQKLVDEMLELNGKVTVDLGEEPNEITVSANHESLKGEPVKFNFEISTNLEELLPANMRDLKEVKDSDEALSKVNWLIAELGLTEKVTMEKVADQDQIKVVFSEGSGLKGEVIFTYTIA